MLAANNVKLRTALFMRLTAVVTSELLTSIQPSRRAWRRHYECPQYKRNYQPERVHPKKSTVFPLAEHFYKLELLLNLTFLPFSHIHN